jgi:hypothetical protein
MARVLPLLIFFVLLLVLVVLAVSSVLRSVRPSDPRRYRPGRRHGESDMDFEDAASVSPGAGGFGTGQTGDASGRRAEASGLTDFLTGAALDPAEGVVRCADCLALYHPDCAALLAERNGGACASCGGTALVRLDDEALRRFRPRDGAPVRAGGQLVVDLVPTDSYEPLLGRVVTVSGRIVGTLPTRRSDEQALLFQDRMLGTECRLSLVGAAASGLRGKAFANGLIGSQVRLRGLLLRHDAQGYQLLVPDPAMVLEASG